MRMMSVRLALREFRDNQVALGDGTSCGVHEFGVFYVRTEKKRFVVREEKVFEVPSRLVMKLRPEKNDVTELTTSSLVKFTIDFFPGTAAQHIFESTARGSFTLTTPTQSPTNNPFDFVRQKVGKKTTYILASSAMTDAQITAVDGMLWDVGSPYRLKAVRFEDDLRAIRPGMSSGSFVPLPDTVNAESNVAGVGLTDIDDATDGAEALSWFRQRAVDIADR